MGWLNEISDTEREVHGEGEQSRSHHSHEKLLAPIRFLDFRENADVVVQEVAEARGGQEQKQAHAGPSQKHDDINQEWAKKPSQGTASGGISLIVIPPNPTRRWMG